MLRAFLMPCVLTLGFDCCNHANEFHVTKQQEEIEKQSNGWRANQYRIIWRKNIKIKLRKKIKEKQYNTAESAREMLADSNATVLVLVLNQEWVFFSYRNKSRNAFAL